MMSFREKCIAITTGALVVAAAVYVVALLQLLHSSSPSEVLYQPLLIGAVVLLVIIVAVGTMVAAIVDRANAGEVVDERARLIEWRGQAMGAYVLAVGVFAALCMAMAEVNWFWIANTLAGMWVLSEVWSGVAKLTMFRRGV